MWHLSDEQIEDFTRLKLTPSDLASVEEHLLICEWCRGSVLVVEEYAAMMRQALADLQSRIN
jgi:predicted anti-sigma-YlaC factor YlaD